jgi:hypothetical protein
VAWSAADELRLLVVHGTLHICGWDHAAPEEEAAMRALERKAAGRNGMTDEHEHEHHHTHDYAQAVEQERHEVAHYYADHFDWRGHEPPADWAGPQYYPTSEKWRLDAWLDKDAPAPATTSSWPHRPASCAT